MDRRPPPDSQITVIVTARDEAERIAATIAGVRSAFPQATVLVADDGSADATAQLAREAGAQLVRGESRLGKGQAATRAARTLMRAGAEPPEGVVVFCDGDLGSSAARLEPLAEAVRDGRADVAVAAFATRIGGGFGLALGFARFAIRTRCGVRTRAPISGQRALRASVLPDVLPFARGFGMELGMTIDAARAGHRVLELELDLRHRASARTPSGFVHRGRQLADFIRAYLARR